MHGGTASAWGVHGSFSSRVGHSAPPPIGNWLTFLVRVRSPISLLGSKQSLEHTDHSDHSVTSQSLGMTQAWKVTGRVSWEQRLQKMNINTLDIKSNSSSPWLPLNVVSNVPGLELNFWILKVKSKISQNSCFSSNCSFCTKTTNFRQTFANLKENWLLSCKNN